VQEGEGREEEEKVGRLDRMSKLDRMGRGPLRLLSTLAACSALIGVAAPSAGAAFGLESFTSTFETPGSSELSAGSHPDVVVRFDFRERVGSGGALLMDGQLRDIEVDLPAGFYGDPGVVPACAMQQLVENEGLCDPAAQVGVFHLENSSGAPSDYPVYNFVAPDEQLAVLGAVAFGVPVRIVLSLRTGGDFGLTASIARINQAVSLPHPVLTLWGVPADPSHDKDRFGPEGLEEDGVPAGIEPKPFLSLPTRCEPLRTATRVDSWQDPGVWQTVSDASPALSGCGELDFSPTLKARPTTRIADSPSGLDVELEIPQSEDPEGRASAHLRAARVELPPGLVVNPSAAGGLGSCLEPARCPDAAKIGTAAVDAAGLIDPLRGSIFLAAPRRNPFGSLLAVYLVLEGRGQAVRLAGEIEADPDSGRLSLVFRDLPQLPFSRLEIKLFGGPLAALRTPPTCGRLITASTLVPWSAPEAPAALPADAYAVDRVPGTGACVGSELELPNSPSFEAGSTVPLAGKYRPFVLNLRRADGTQEFSTLALSLPPGLTADLSGVETCDDPPNCSAGSQVGEVFADAGAGPAPYPFGGSVYLTGPYKETPLALAMVVPVRAGPLDLGAVVVRTALQVDPITAQITVRTDPLPAILEGIPLDVRHLSVRLDRPAFIRNPTSCDPAEVSGMLRSTEGDEARLTNRFQLGECGRLSFEPRVGIRLIGATRRSAHPALRIVVDNRKSTANIGRAAITLPRTELLASSNIRGVCSRSEFARHACPRDSVYGRATATSPLLNAPLRGAVFLRENKGRRLPDLVASLDGRTHLDLVGRVDSPGGRIRATFATPDLPLRRFVLNLAPGKRSLVVNTGGVCGRAVPRAQVKVAAHNGEVRGVAPRLRASCPGDRG
jgi:hypothetical protein